MEQTPSIGRIVTYARPADGIVDELECPAIITDVWDAEAGGVKLTAFPPDAMPAPISGIVKFDEDASTGTWHWPERV